MQHWEAGVRAGSRSFRQCLKRPYSESAEHEHMMLTGRHTGSIARIPSYASSQAWLTSRMRGLRVPGVITSPPLLLGRR